MASIRASLIGLFACAASTAVLAGGPPNMWELNQNDPNPFCPEEEVTTIEFAAPEVADVQLVVLDSDGSEDVVRTIADGALPAGFFSYLWDGRNDADVILPDGSYPYRLIARESGGGSLLFEGERTAVLDCSTPTETRSWGRVKVRFVSE